VNNEIVTSTISDLTSDSISTENTSNNNSETITIKSVTSINFNRKDGQSRSNIKYRSSKRKKISMLRKYTNDMSIKTQNPNSYDLFGLSILPNKQYQMKRRLLYYYRRYHYKKC